MPGYMNAVCKECVTSGYVNAVCNGMGLCLGK